MIKYRIVQYNNEYFLKFLFDDGWQFLETIKRRSLTFTKDVELALGVSSFANCVQLLEQVRSRCEAEVIFEEGEL